MKTEQRQWSDGSWNILKDNDLGQNANLVLAFGARTPLSDAARYNEIKEFYPNADILMGSTSGEIMDIEVNDDTISLTAVQFEKTPLKTCLIDIDSMSDSFAAGEAVANELLSDDLNHVFVVSDGLKVNGNELVKGLSNVLPEKVRSLR